MRYKIFFILIIILTNYTCNGQSKRDIFFLQGTIKGCDTGVVYLSYTNEK